MYSYLREHSNTIENEIQSLLVIADDDDYYDDDDSEDELGLGGTPYYNGGGTPLHVLAKNPFAP
eukprot:CAMPEP_0194074690 /NCGR_PEP_ID=MMETSP0149-20130528/1796_1 /TAXON_ID=122233 /ORGANISM="Chaetoceros debilis, Strain MM31A-1" /LENGTH=63 /DNA_ID=CAMNT_0038754945 /DNA_START=1 /DNA_END=189 /DNA_ORIENTATION=-